ncbi:hypothetical protein CC1G_04906 [Coprinopsis cinerea okayama7|uniref:Uncharacterized protein n=1 Tax=Coprinopsis cinerea (strain Okayama-7 / 130 / ATCC MYA-4618 / FGSC 9003) TaxID=240176 RepID=A8PFH2_COPC7|nr:hypothetical protein CC1G_04906 [Coprinopsis cinerea okayama7\|eukprot:XP_001841062.2 hypothetical protein CC1G_04906 [Coprinopsis cinerea okayama7\
MALGVALPPQAPIRQKTLQQAELATNCYPVPGGLTCNLYTTAFRVKRHRMLTQNSRFFKHNFEIVANAARSQLAREDPSDTVISSMLFGLRIALRGSNPPRYRGMCDIAVLFLVVSFVCTITGVFLIAPMYLASVSSSDKPPT